MAELPASRPARVLLDGVGSGALADSLLPGLAAAGRPGLRVSAGDFLRPAGERFEWGREDVEAFRERWLDVAALAREVLVPVREGRYLPALWDAARDRSARAAVVAAPAGGILLLDGVLLLGRGLPADSPCTSRCRPGRCAAAACRSGSCRRSRRTTTRCAPATAATCWCGRRIRSGRRC
jgi:hypothetical protein